ncbi:MAG: hypothetical protein KAH77_00335 [Thiomargarita sp.]|nr:hypothetical protein [Thiomargarita sp.]
MTFQEHFQGRFFNMLRWSQLDQLWETVNAQPNHWYVYFVGDTVPTIPMLADELKQFIQELDQLLHKEHDYNYCGIVYVDDRDTPTMIKIFDPNNLGASCGSSGSVVPPRWLLTQFPPEAIIDNAPTPANRRRWWQRLFSNSEEKK